MTGCQRDKPSKQTRGGPAPKRRACAKWEWACRVLPRGDRAGADRPPAISRKTKIQIFMWNFLFFFKHWPLSQKIFKGTSLVVQGLRSCLAIQGMQVRFLVGQLRLSAAPSGQCAPEPAGRSQRARAPQGKVPQETSGLQAQQLRPKPAK